MKILTQATVAFPAALGFALFVPAQAAVLSGTAAYSSGSACSGGVAISTSTPSSIGSTATNANCLIRAFDEAQGTALTSALLNDPIDLTLGSGIKTTSGGSLASGTVVNSHLINFQPSAGILAGGQTVTGSITFANNILAVVYSNLGLTANQGFLNTDYLHQAATTYGYNQFFGVETNAERSFTVSGNTLNFTLGGYYSSAILRDMDNLRVLTEVPAPASIALLGLGGLGLFFMRRKKVAV
jgi:PEP-CTERM motif